MLKCRITRRGDRRAACREVCREICREGSATRETKFHPLSETLSFVCFSNVVDEKKKKVIIRVANSCLACVGVVFGFLPERYCVFVLFVRSSSGFSSVGVNRRYGALRSS